MARLIRGLKELTSRLMTTYNIGLKVIKFGDMVVFGGDLGDEAVTGPRKFAFRFG